MRDSMERGFPKFPGFGHPSPGSMDLYGLTQKDLDSLKEFSQAQRKESCPFPDVVRSSVEGSSGPIVWLNPQITCWVCFLEWTDKGYLRHPRILGFTDLRAEEANGREWSMDD